MAGWEHRWISHRSRRGSATTVPIRCPFRRGTIKLRRVAGIRDGRPEAGARSWWQVISPPRGIACTALGEKRLTLVCQQFAINSGRYGTAERTLNGSRLHTGPTRGGGPWRTASPAASLEARQLSCSHDISFCFRSKAAFRLSGELEATISDCHRRKAAPPLCGHPERTSGTGKGAIQPSISSVNRRRLSRAAHKKRTTAPGQLQTLGTQP